MNRRAILKILATATFAAAVEVAGLSACIKKVVTRVVPNPEYYTAECEAVVFWDTVKKEGLVEIHRGLDAAKAREGEWLKKYGGIADPCGVALVPDAVRPRYNFVDGKYVEVPYFVTYEEDAP